MGETAPRPLTYPRPATFFYLPGPKEFAEDPFFEWDIETKGLIPAWVEEAINKAAAMDQHHNTSSSSTTSPSKRIHASKPKSAHIKSPFAADKSFNTMERSMDDEVETVLRDWNENVKRREKETFHVRPIRSSSQRSRGTSSNIGGGLGHSERSFGGENDPKAKYLNIERVHDKESYDGSDDSSSTESIQEDDMRRPMYVTCPRTGRKIVRMQFDVHGFESRDIKVKAVGRKVIIFAVHKETDSGRKSTNEFCRKINLPEDVDVDRLQCTFSSGLLCLEAPVFVRPASLSGSRHSINSISSRGGLSGTQQTPPEAPLNTPFVKASEMGQVMHINVEVGRVFRADDVVVKLRGNDKLIVTAARDEDHEHSSLCASIKREFRLPRRIHPHSLRAGLTNDGILNVTAVIDEAVLTNGNTNNSNASKPAHSNPPSAPSSTAAATTTASTTASTSASGSGHSSHHSHHSAASTPITCTTNSSHNRIPTIKTTPPNNKPTTTTAIGSSSSNRPSSSNTTMTVGNNKSAAAAAAASATIISNKNAVNHSKNSSAGTTPKP